MAVIDVVQGVRHTPEQFIAKMRKNKKLNHIACEPINVVYSPCWIFAFGITFAIGKRHTRHVGWYGGVDEQTVSPGVVQYLPTVESVTVEDMQILASKLTQEQAEELAWEYNKRWIKKKFRILFSPPERASVETHRYYKPVYLMKFYNKKLDQTLIKAMDSLTGDFETIQISQQMQQETAS